MPFNMAKLDEFAKGHESIIVAIGVGIAGLLAYHAYANQAGSPSQGVGAYTGGSNPYTPVTSQPIDPTQSAIDLLNAQTQSQITLGQYSVQNFTDMQHAQLDAAKNQYDFLFAPPGPTTAQPVSSTPVTTTGNGGRWSGGTTQPTTPYQQWLNSGGGPGLHPG